MKQFLLFAGQDDTSARGVQGLVGDFDSFAEAFVSLIDQQTASRWWQILDIKTGEVVERRHLKISNNMIGFQRSDWTVGNPSRLDAVTPLPLPKAALLPRVPNLVRLEADLRAPTTLGVRNGSSDHDPQDHRGSRTSVAAL